MKAERCEALVVGGGLAGVTAARDLARSGLQTVLLEGRDRLGGRTATQRLAGRDVDTGGTYFHWFQAAIWAEVQRYELELVERPLGDRYLIGTRAGLVEMPPEEVDARLRRALARFWDDGRYPSVLARPFAVQDEPAVAELDARSVEDRLGELALDPVDDSLLRGIFTDFGRALNDVSLAWVLQRMANAAWSYEAFNALFAVYRLRDGMRGLIDAMVRDGGFDVRCSSPVVAIDHGERGGTVRLEDGSVLEADAIVLATPVNVWQSLAFSPPLPDLHRAATREGVAAPALSNVVMHVRGVPGTLELYAPFGDQPFEFLFTYAQLDDGQLLSGYSMSGRVTMARGRDALQAALRSIVPEAELVDVAGHDWATDPYALGGSGSLAPGQLTRFVDVLDRPQGRLFVASGDVAPHFSGFLSGAIESGARAARRAALALGVDGAATTARRAA